MSRRKSSKNNYIWQSMAIFGGVVLALVLAYCLKDGGFHMEYSISRYVGREVWSAVVFAIGNLVIVWEISRYVRVVWKDYGKAWLVMMILMMICFVGLSLCPIGLFDETFGDYGVVSVLHQIFSRGMFAIMALVTVAKGVKEMTKRRKVAVACICFAVWALVLAVASMTTQVFWDLNFVLESSYIYLFMIMLML